MTRISDKSKCLYNVIYVIYKLQYHSKPTIAINTTRFESILRKSHEHFIS